MRSVLNILMSSLVSLLYTGHTHYSRSIYPTKLAPVCTIRLIAMHTVEYWSYYTHNTRQSAHTRRLFSAFLISKKGFGIVNQHFHQFIFIKA